MIFDIKVKKVLFLLICLSIFSLGFFDFVEAVGKGFCPLSEGGMVPCGRRTDDPRTGNVCECYPCELCHIFVLFRRVLDFVLKIAVGSVALFMFVLGGGMLVVGGSTPSWIETGGTILKNAALGLLIILVAWMGVNTLFNYLGVADWTDLTKNWHEVSCAYCGDGVCDPGRGEGPITCPLDCMAFAWVPLSARDRIVQISLSETRLPDGSIIGPGEKVKTYDVGDNPSRVTVILGGDVWVGNRNSGDVTKLSPDDDNLPYYRVAGTYNVGGAPRAVTYDADGYIWVGSHNGSHSEDRTLKKLNPASGGVIDTVNMGTGSSAYGAIGDPFGNVWVSSRDSNEVIRINTKTASPQVANKIFVEHDVYGIAMDNEADIWIGKHGGKGLWEIDGVDGGEVESVVKKCLTDEVITGVAVDGDNNVWANSHNANKTFVVRGGNCGDVVSISSTCRNWGHDNGRPHGVAIDINNNAWIVCRRGEVVNLELTESGINVIRRVNLDACCGSGHTNNASYNYSDMTGFRSMGCPSLAE